jgi:hypothetical protein
MLTCILHIDGSQNPDLGRKSHGYSFWDADGVIHIDILEAGTTINSRVLHSTLKTMKQQLRKVQKHEKNILLPNNNARPHTL